MKKSIKIIAAAAAVSLLLAGCGTGGSTRETVTFDNKNYSSDVTSLVIESAVPSELTQLESCGSLVSLTITVVGEGDVSLGFAKKLKQLKALDITIVGSDRKADLSGLAGCGSLDELTVKADCELAGAESALKGCTLLREIRLDTPLLALDFLSGNTSVSELTLFSYKGGLDPLSQSRVEVLRIDSESGNDLTEAAAIPFIRTVQLNAWQATDISPLIGVKNIEQLLIVMASDQIGAQTLKNVTVTPDNADLLRELKTDIPLSQLTAFLDQGFITLFLAKDAR